MNFEAFNCLLVQLQTMFNTFWFGMVQHGDERSNGLLMFLFSDQNRRGLEILNDTLQDNNGIRRKVKLTNRKKLCLKLACADWECDTPVQTYIVTPEATEIVLSAGPCYLFSPDSPVAPMVPSWDPDEFRDLCVDQPQMLADTIAEYVANLEYELEKKYLGDLRTNIIPTTCDADGAPRPSVALFMPHADTPQSPYANPLVYNTIDEQFRKTFTSGSYAIIGGTRMKAYMDRRGIQNGGSFSTGNSTLPVNNGRGQWRFYYSWAFDDVFEEESFLTIRDGVLHILQWSENKGYKSERSEDTVRWSYFRSMSGLMYDMDWSKEVTGTARKCVKISYAIRHTGELYVAPGGGCDVNDCYNGVLWWRDCGLDPWFKCAPVDPVQPCDDLSASYTEGRYLNYEGAIGIDASAAVLSIDGKSYVATPSVSDPVLVASELEALIKIDYPWATVNIVNGKFQVLGVTSTVTLSTINGSQNLSRISENHIVTISPVGAETSVISVGGIEVFNGPILDQSLTNGVVINSGTIYIVQGNTVLPADIVASFANSSCPDPFILHFDWNQIIPRNARKEASSHFVLTGAETKKNASLGGLFGKGETTWTEQSLIEALATNPDYPVLYEDGSKIDPNNAYISDFELGISYVEGIEQEKSGENKSIPIIGALINNGPPLALKLGNSKIARKKGAGTNRNLILPVGMHVPTSVTIREKIV